MSFYEPPKDEDGNIIDYSQFSVELPFHVKLVGLIKDWAIIIAILLLLGFCMSFLGIDDDGGYGRDYGRQ